MTATILRFPARMRVIAYDQLEADIAAAVRASVRANSAAYREALERELHREAECREVDLPADSEWPA
jgi:hypothetical protein